MEKECGLHCVKASEARLAFMACIFTPQEKPFVSSVHPYILLPSL
jgi:hypothetical protein